VLEHVKKHDLPPSRFVAPDQTFKTVTDKISGIILTPRTPIAWFLGFAFGFSLLQLLLVSITYLLFKGVGIWGLNQPVGWGLDIINFVWWIGIGHAGTLISAVLLLFRQQWRMSISRAAEAMTIFAVACAAMFPLIHTGRPWLSAYWLFPYPNAMSIWPNFRSPLIWDVFAVSTYGTVSILFWYVGLIPDLASMRDRAKNRFAQVAYGMVAMGWRGSARHWQRYELASLLLAGLSTPLVLSVHTVVSFDFAVSVIPGWHATIFPPYFVAGAVYAGFAMVLTLMLPMRWLYGLDDYITVRHVDNMAKVTLVTGMIVFYGYLMEAFFGFYSANQFEAFMITNRMTGPYAPLYWFLITCNGVVPQLLWMKTFRTKAIPLFIVCMFVNVGMWLERFIIIPTSLHRDFMPSSWGMYFPSFWDWTTFAGTIGLFITLFYLFVRVLPMIAIFEVKTLTPGAKTSHGHEAEEGSHV
jgi:Ni/Fe-hydrogenase subunit HybB-like protein